MAEIVASDTPYARATTLGTHTQVYRATPLPSATVAATAFSTEDWAFCCYRRRKCSDIPMAQYILTILITGTPSFRL